MGIIIKKIDEEYWLYHIYIKYVHDKPDKNHSGARTYEVIGKIQELYGFELDKEYYDYNSYRDFEKDGEYYKLKEIKDWTK